MRLLTEVLGHQEILSKILESFEKGQPAQTFLFVGPSGIGKQKSAVALAQALLCHKNSRACGVCGDCLRVASGRHESLKVLSLGKSQIKIEEARGILDFLSLKSLSQKRIVIIDQAQMMNSQTGNSLLKILEEPPEGTYFFLIAPATKSVLPTIRSRARVVAFKPLAEKELARKHSTAEAWMLKSSFGSFERIELLKDREEQEVRKKAAEILALLVRDDDFLNHETWRDSLRDRQTAQRIFSYWVSFLRDALILKMGASELLQNVDFTKFLESLAALSGPKLEFLVLECLKAEQSFHFNQDPVLMTERISVLAKRAEHVD